MSLAVTYSCAMCNGTHAISSIRQRDTASERRSLLAVDHHAEPDQRLTMCAESLARNAREHNSVIMDRERKRGDM